MTYRYELEQIATSISRLGIGSLYLRTCKSRFFSLAKTKFVREHKSQLWRNDWLTHDREQKLSVQVKVTEYFTFIGEKENNDMRVMRKISLPFCVLQIAVIQTMFWENGAGSVLPRPNYKVERATTQLLNTVKNYSDETVIIVTSSELPKQIPPPPTPTKSHGVTPQYDSSWDSKEDRSKANKKRADFSGPFHALESAITFQELAWFDRFEFL